MVGRRVDSVVHRSNIVSLETKWGGGGGEQCESGQCCT